MNTWIETKRLIIRAPNENDLDNLCQLQSDPDVMCYVGQGIRTRETVQEGLQKNLQHQANYGFSLGAVFLKATNTFIGRAGLIYLGFDDTQPEIEVGYMLHKAYWGNGYATELTKACVDWGFKNLAVNKLAAVIQPENEASRQVLEKSGFLYLGRDIYNDIEVARYDIYRKNLDVKSVELSPAKKEDYEIVKNMSSFYAYDISRYMGRHDGWEFNHDGTYEGLETVALYWQEQDRYPFIIRVHNEIAGFVLVNKIGSASDIDWNMGEFFIAAKFQGKGLGKYIAQKCFDLFRGSWEVMVIPGNEGAYRFWRSTIQDYTNKNFKEYTRFVGYKNTLRNIFRFESIL